MKRAAKLLIPLLMLSVMLAGCGKDGSDNSIRNEGTTRETLPDYLEEKLDEELESIMEDAERKKKEAEEARKQDYEYLEGISGEIIRCLDEKDAESLKAMFSVSTRNNFELDRRSA